MIASGASGLREIWWDARAGTCLWWRCSAGLLCDCEINKTENMYLSAAK